MEIINKYWKTALISELENPINLKTIKRISNVDLEISFVVITPFILLRFQNEK